MSARSEGHGHLKQVGTPARRQDALAKVTGSAVFSGDVQLDKVLHAVIVRSTHAKGRVLSIDTAAAKAMDGVEAVLTAEDLMVAPVRAKALRFGPITQDQPILAEGSVRYIGEPVAAVCAVDLESARQAAKSIIVDIDPEEAATTLEESLAPGAPLVHPIGYGLDRGTGPSLPLVYGESNAVLSHDITSGDVDAAFAAADKVIEGTYEFPSSYHYAMEPHTVVASADSERITVWSSAQHPYLVQRDIARLFGHPVSKVRVVASFLGGGFGSKSFTHMEPLTIALAKTARRPVRLELSVGEAMKVTRRHNARMHARSAVDAEGKILAFDAELFLDSGAYALTGPLVAIKAAVRALSGYDFPNYRVKSHFVYVNTSPAGSYRAIGGPQGAWCVESHLDEVADAIGADPVELRKDLVAPQGKEFRVGRLEMDADLRKNLTKLQELMRQAEAQVTAPVASWKVGTGAALGVADPGALPGSSAIVKLSSDGSVTVMVGSSELGQGVRTIVAQVAAETLDVGIDCVSVMETDTGYGPYDTSTGASRSTTMTGLATYRAARKVRDRLLEAAAKHSEEVEDLHTEGGSVVAASGKSRPYGDIVSERWGQAGGNLIEVGEVIGEDFPRTPPFWEISSGAATIGVDEETGEIKVLAYSCVSDVGRVINPVTLEGQEEGAIAQGLGHTLLESLRWEGGDMLNSSIIDYRVPRFDDIPPLMNSHFIEDGQGPGPFGSKGGGEGPIMPVAGAVAAALHAATGLRIRDLPLTPERVWRALRSRGSDAIKDGSPSAANDAGKD